MKKISLFLVSLVTSIIFINNVNAATATAKVTASSTRIVAGNTVRIRVNISSGAPLGSWEYSLNYDKDLMRLVSSDVTPHYAAAATNSNTKSVTYNYSFKSLKSGKATFSLSSVAVLDWDVVNMGVNRSGVTVNIITQADLEASYSKDNYLKSLSIEGYEMDFNKDNTEYSLTVEPEVKSITINGTKNDSRSTISGLGTKDLTEGLNKIYVVVTAQNGTKRTYTINVNVKELQPINVTIGETQYTVVRSLEGINIPNTFVEKTMTIDEEEFTSVYNEKTDITLVLLKDVDGNINFYQYENNNYKKFNYLNFGNLNIQVLDLDEILKGYIKKTEVLNEEKIEVLKVDEESPYSLIKGLNLETNEANFYSYDEKENTIQRYILQEEKILSNIKEENNIYLWLAVVFATISIILLITLIILVEKKKPKKEKKPNKKEKVTKETKPNDKKLKKQKKSKDAIDEWFEE